MMKRRTACRGLSLALMALAAPLASAAEPFAASEPAIELDKQIDWSNAKLIAVQEAGRYKTLDSFARERVAAMYGKEHLPGLSPLASMFELLFNAPAYDETPMVRIKDRGLRLHFTDGQLAESARQRIRATGYMTPRELAEPAVQRRIAELEPRFEMGRAVGRVRNAEATVRSLDRMLRVVPRPRAAEDALWYTPGELRTSAMLALPESERPGVEQLMRQYGPPAADLRPEAAATVSGQWLRLRDAWMARDAAGVQARLADLAAVLPTLATAGVYPAASQRQAEARYYALGKFTWGFLIYALGAVVSVWALITRWRTPWAIAFVLLVVALGFHAYGVGLRWYILGRIPVANMFEAVVGGLGAAIAVALLLELFYRTRILLLAGHVVGFLALVLAGYVVPGGGTITSVMGILDDVMLRIHTVMIVISYGLILLGAVIAAVYLFGYYFHTQRERSAQAGIIAAVLGAATLAVVYIAFESTARTASGLAPIPGLSLASTVAAAVNLLLLIMLMRSGGGGLVNTGLTMLLIVFATLAVGSRPLASGVAWSLLGGGLTWAALNGLGLLRGAPAAIVATVPVRGRRPILAGAAPSDEGIGPTLPGWLYDADWCHLIVLNIAFVLLFFGGIVLGAAWADYSWGRPWGWDPKETFALNTWLIYAVLIHARFVVKRKGLWTAWLSLIGCALMLFNWFVVNLYIVGLHSYA